MFNSKFTKKDSVAEEIEKIISERWDDDDEDDDVKRADAELRRMKVKPIEADKKTDPDKEFSRLSKKSRPEEMDEESEQIDELSKKTLGNYMRANTKRMADPKNPDSMERKMKRHDDYFKASKKFHEDAVTEDKWTDIADGPWKKSKRTPGQSASAAANAAGKGLKGAQHKLDVAKPKGKLTAADFKKLRKEDAEQIDELSKNTLGSYVKKSSDAADKHLKLANSAAQRSKTKADTAQYMKHSEKFGKRIGGIVTAKNKLAREETELSEKTLTPAESKKKEEIVKSMKKSASGFKERYGKRAKEVMYATATKQAKRVAEEVEQMNESHYGDMSHAAKELVLHADNHQHLYHSSHVPIMNNLRKKMKKGEYHPEKAKKLWAYHADRAAQSYAKEHGDGKPWHKMFSTADRKAAAAHFEDMHRHELSESKGPTSDYGLETFATNPTNESTPLDKAKMVAKAALAKVKNEMLGKAGATSEEIDPRIKTTDTLKGRIKGGQKDDVGPGANGKSTKVKYTPGPK